MMKPFVRQRTRSVIFRITESDWKIVQGLAKKYTDGNCSAWMRARITEKPKRAEKEKPNP